MGHICTINGLLCDPERTQGLAGSPATLAFNCVNQIRDQAGGTFTPGTYMAIKPTSRKNPFGLLSPADQARLICAARRICRALAEIIEIKQTERRLAQIDPTWREACDEAGASRGAASVLAEGATEQTWQ
jgi:hypothetical protein